MSGEGNEMATSKYDLLAALIEAQGKEFKDESGWHYVLMGVVHRLGEGYGSEEALADELFQFIADAAIPEETDVEPES